ncbi:ubiquitin--protein ligase [Teladorsagia circumcincta]|uniref:Ubiquitin--protein ligase n=1 Tax=Teladorsagia circumcincta TaxID=45464 RepID=A0A2G9UGR7_TELCI|nr:ubiquitin--protein ligase [Teladorsagia circumcincta]
MLNLQKRINGIDDNKKYMETRIAIREKLLAQEIKDLEVNLKNQNMCKLSFPSTSQLHEMILTVCPQEGIYRGGVFKFSISVPPEYNNVVIHGLSSLFTDLIDFDDALNMQAAQLWSTNREQFTHRARDYIAKYCERR